MKTHLRLLALVLLLPGRISVAEPLPPPPPPAASPLPAGVVATVNGQPIPERLVETFLRNGREALEINPATGDGLRQLAKLREGIISELIERALIAQGVQQLGLEPTEAQIDADEKPMRDFSITEERYQAFLTQNGFTRQEYRDVVLRSAARGKALIEALSRDLAVPDAEVASYHQAHLNDADLRWPERVTGAHILVNAQPGVLGARLELERGLLPDSPEMATAVAEETVRRRARAEEVRAQAVGPGADFATLAAQCSEDVGTRGDGGSLGTFARGTHPLALDDAFFALPVGGIGPVVKTDFGFHVIKTLDHQPAGPRSLAEATPLIQARLFAAKRGERLRDWLREARAKATIVVAQDAPPGPMEPR